MSGRGHVRLAVLASGNGSNFQALADASAAGRLGGARLEVLVCDREGAFVLERAAQAGIPAVRLDPRAHSERKDFDAALLDTLHAWNVELVVLAGWMRILSAPVVHAFRGRMINVHPSLLPDFPGMHALRQALQARVPVTGATVHYVDEGVDTGEILAQEPVEVFADDDEASLAARVHSIEHRLLVRTVAELAAARAARTASATQVHAPR